ncbi:uncharacterized protein TNCV_2898041 [Trichonephila clavipes]|nr:uncharacterized protein TNCV_2898041 [Trichonephila clavipes]
MGIPLHVLQTLWMPKSIASLRADHYREINIDKDGRRTYRTDNCPDIELLPADIFDCPPILAAIQEIGVLFSSTNFYEDDIEQIARTVVDCPTRRPK